MKNTLNDDSEMPFGKHEGELMFTVPASYFHWLWVNGKKEDKLCPVADYIRKNKDALAQEHPDGIWE